MMVFSLVACGGNNGPETDSNSKNTSTPTENNSSSKEQQTDGKTGKILVAYFSHTGNTQTMANMINKRVGGDLFRIETVNPYPEDHKKVVDQAAEEQKNNARPKLATHVKDMDSYDVIFVGYPNWWGTLPMAVFTFLEEYDFSGKTIIPFSTHNGSVMGRSERDIAKLCPNSTLLDGLAVRGSSVNNAQNDVDEWLKKIGIVD